MNALNESLRMSDLNTYLAQHYLNAIQLASAAAIDMAELDELLHKRLIPAPAYVVSGNNTVHSFVFGDMAAPGATPGRYFPPAQLTWIAIARHASASAAMHDVESHLKEQFTARYAAALATLNLTTWRLPDSFDATGAAIAAGLRVRTESAWTYFLNGTFSLCVANPISEAHIAHKEVLQEKLAQQSENGQKIRFPPQQVPALHTLIDAYAAAAMPFSPIEYALSSRKRLVEDLRKKLPLAGR